MARPTWCCSVSSGCTSSEGARHQTPLPPRAGPVAGAPRLAPSRPARGPAPEDARWHFAFTPYLWATSQEGEASFKGIPPQPIEVSFGDIWENLDFAALGAFEAHNGRWGVATDMVFMNLGAKIPREVLGRPEP